MLAFSRSSLPMLVMISSCLCLSAIIFTLDKITADKKPLLKGGPSLTSACAGLFESRGSGLRLLLIYIQC